MYLIGKAVIHTFNSFTPDSINYKIKKILLNLQSGKNEKQTALQLSTAQEIFNKWSHLEISPLSQKLDNFVSPKI